MIKGTKTILLFLSTVFFANYTASQIPALGDSNYIEIGNWNVEWFGDSTYGPTNEGLQQSNVYDVLKKTDVDLWGLCEVSDNNAWQKLLQKLPEYGGVISTWSQTQKTALLYKKSIFTVLYSKHILAEYDREFASGRLPLEVGLEVTWKNKKDTIYAFVIHLKANTGTSAEKATAYDLRKRSSQFLKEYTDASFKNKKFIILGDWNDDLDVSIYNSLATPFGMLLGDTTNYFFTSLNLTNTGKKSTVSYSNMIDHQCISKRMKYFYLTNSSTVTYLGTYINGYGNNTTDHYPVVSKFDFTRKEPVFNHIKNIQNQASIIFENGIWYSPNLQAEVHPVFYSMNGKLISDNHIQKNIFYVYHFKWNNNLYSGKILMQ